MKIGFLQYNVKQYDPSGNLSFIEAKVNDLKFDLLVLPELFTTGYAFDSKEDIFPFGENLAESPTVKFLIELMQNCDGYITGSIPELDNGKLYNTSILVGKEGLVASYRKIHITDYEKRAYSAGNSFVVQKCNKVPVGLTICFDCWFAPLSSRLKLDGAEIICHSACFGGDITPKIIPIRALENQCFYISCNRIGSELFGDSPESYCGRSQIVNPSGEVIFSADDKECLAILDIDISDTKKTKLGSLISKDIEREHSKYAIELFDKHNK